MFKLGQNFNSYEEFQSELDKYQKKHFYNFSISDCRTLENARKRYPKLNNLRPNNLKYYCVKYICVHGGVYKKKKKCLEQRSTSTLRQDCPAFIYLRVNNDCTKLEITQMNESHNHPTSQILYNNLPNQRRLSPQTRSEVIALMDMKANKKLIQAKIQSETGQYVTLKDLSNVYSTAKQYTNKRFVDLVDDLRSVYNCDVEVLIDSNESFLGIFIQDKRMKHEFQAFPEVVYCDATYKLTDIKIPLYVLLIEDGNGQSEIVAIGLLVNEQQETLQWFFQKFKDLNSACSITKAFITDKDIKEQAVIKSLFPNAEIVICLFHALRTFNREICSEKMDITPKQRDLCKKYYEELCYARNEIDYQTIYKKFIDEAPIQVIDYFKNNWHRIRSQWVKSLVHNCGNSFNTTNNSLESFNAKLKSVIPAFSNLPEFFKQLFIILKCLRNERDINTMQIIQKCPTAKFNDTNTYLYYKLLTPYAFNYLKKHLSSTNVNVPDDVTIQFCNCGFFKSMRLPCKHIITKRRQTNNPIFDEALCDRRWTRKYYYKSHTVFVEPAQQDETFLNNAVEPQKKNILSCHEKYRKASISGMKLAEIMSMTSQSDFECKLQQLEDIISIWSKGEEFSIQNVSSKITDDANMNNINDAIEVCVIDLNVSTEITDYGTEEVWMTDLNMKTEITDSGEVSMSTTI